MNSSLKSTPAQWVARVAGYVLGLFLIAVGVAVSINSNLGTSPVSSLPYVISQITGRALSLCVAVNFCVYVSLQALILRKKFRPVQLLQVLFSILFGYFTDFTRALVGDFCLPGYVGRLGMLVISILFIAFGVFLYVEARLVPMALEGLALTIAERFGKPFPTMKMTMDCAVVATGILLSFVFLGRLVGIREGTVVTALLVGRLVGAIRKPCLAPLQKLCFLPLET